ncbi:hypothetical protein FS837_001745 [Tulasnella sp. UAMH 9824]|nr:hypothetical protein FS837_001745 [Tulasnella sp. UAMH 9824]
MSASVRETENASRSTTAQDAAIDQVEAAMRRLRISPRKVLGSLSHLRIDRARIKLIEDQVPKSGGKADVQAAMLASAPSSTLSEPDDAEYVAIKRLRLDENTDDDRTLAVSPDGSASREQRGILTDPDSPPRHSKPLAHEVNLLNGLSHENVVKIFGFVEEVSQGIAWMVFAWEKNGNLREFIRSAGWELPERVSLLNILVNAESRAIITDFGSARAVGLVEDDGAEGVRAAKPASTSSPAPTGAQNAEALSAEIAPSGEFITMTGPAWTVRWAAPELLDGYLPGLASDVWALGWICWEAVTGNFPFDKEDDTAVVLRIAKGDLPTIENDDQLKQLKMLCSLMRDCWKLDMNERPTALRCQKVVQWMDQAVPSRREGNSSSITRSSGLLRALGRLQLRNGMHTEGRELFGQSLKVAESVGDEYGQAEALRAIGDTLYLQDEYSKAEESFVQARDIYLRIGKQLGFAQSRGFAQSVKALGDVHRMRTEYSKAEEAYIHAREVHSQIGDQFGFAQCSEGMGRLHSTRGEYAKAAESYAEAQRIYHRIGDMYSSANISWYLAWLHRDQAQYEAAERLVREASAIYDGLGLTQDANECEEFLEAIRQLMK